MGCAIMALATLIELLGCNRDLHTVVTSLKHFSEELMRIGSYEVVKYRGHRAEGLKLGTYEALSSVTSWVSS
jgi:hypothetical protein